MSHRFMIFEKYIFRALNINNHDEVLIIKA